MHVVRYKQEEGMNQVELFEVGDTRYRLEPEDDDGGWVLSYWIPWDEKTDGPINNQAWILGSGGYWHACASGPYRFCKMSAR